MAHRVTVNNEGQAKLFDNQYLERLTKANPFVIWGMYVPILFFLVYKDRKSVV